MPTVRCPSCSRALNLPDFADIQAARCPLCQATFDVPARPDSAPPGPADADAGDQLVPPDRVDPELQADHAALHSAVGWLKAAALFSLVNALGCGCFSFPSDSTDNPLVVGLFFGYLTRLAVSLLVWWGAESLNRRTRLEVAVAGSVGAVVLSGLSALLLLPLLLSAVHALPDLTEGVLNLEDTLMFSLVGGFHLAIVVLFLVAGSKGIAVLRRPSVRQGFTGSAFSSPDEED
jgi:hypothetical protein